MFHFHLPPSTFWESTPHEFIAACEAGRRPADKQRGRSVLSAADIEEFKRRNAECREAEARHRAKVKNGDKN